MKKIFLSFTMLSFCLIANAIDKNLERINDIKKDREYLYGEATMPSLEEAVSLAYELLQKEILDWAAERVNKPIGSVSPKDINQLVDTIVTRRADMYRVFAYVKKLKLNTIFYENGIAFLEEDDYGKIDTSDGKPTQQTTATEKRDSMATDNVLKQIHSKFFPTPDKEAPTQQGNAVVDRIKKAKNFFDLKNILPPLKEEGLIADYGKLATAEHLEECLLIIYDAAGNIKAILGKGLETRPNLNTGKDDTLDNYRGCGAIWIKTN